MYLKMEEHNRNLILCHCCDEMCIATIKRNDIIVSEFSQSDKSWLKVTISLKNLYRKELFLISSAPSPIDHS